MIRRAAVGLAVLGWLVLGARVAGALIDTSTPVASLVIAGDCSTLSITFNDDGTGSVGDGRNGTLAFAAPTGVTIPSIIPRCDGSGLDMCDGSDDTYQTSITIGEEWDGGERTVTGTFTNGTPRVWRGSDGLCIDAQYCGEMTSFELPSQCQPLPGSTNPFATATPWARPTLTPYPTPESTLAIDMSQDDLPWHTADSIIQLYNWLNQSNVVDFMLWVALTFFLLGLVFRIIRKVKAEG